MYGAIQRNHPKEVKKHYYLSIRKFWDFILSSPVL